MALKFPYPKDPASDLDYIINWSEWIGSDTILTSSWVIPSPLTSSGDSFNDTVSTVWIAGGVDGESYTLVNTITTNAGRTAQRDAILKVKNK